MSLLPQPNITVTTSLLSLTSVICNLIFSFYSQSDHYYLLKFKYNLIYMITYIIITFLFYSIYCAFSALLLLLLHFFCTTISVHYFWNSMLTLYLSSSTQNSTLFSTSVTLLSVSTTDISISCTTQKSFTFSIPLTFLSVSLTDSSTCLQHKSHILSISLTFVSISLTDTSTLLLPTSTLSLTLVHLVCTLSF